MNQKVDSMRTSKRVIFEKRKILKKGEEEESDD